MTFSVSAAGLVWWSGSKPPGVRMRLIQVPNPRTNLPVGVSPSPCTQSLKHRWVPLYPNMDNPNSQTIQSPLFTHFLSLQCLFAHLIQNSVNLKEFSLALIYRIKREVPVLHSHWVIWRWASVIHGAGQFGHPLPATIFRSGSHIAPVSEWKQAQLSPSWPLTFPCFFCLLHSTTIYLLNFFPNAIETCKTSLSKGSRGMTSSASASDSCSCTRICASVAVFR